MGYVSSKLQVHVAACVYSYTYSVVMDKILSELPAGTWLVYSAVNLLAAYVIKQVLAPSDKNFKLDHVDFRLLAR